MHFLQFYDETFCKLKKHVFKIFQLNIKDINNREKTETA